MKIAFVNTPWTVTPFPVHTGDSIGLCTQALALRLGTVQDVVIYGHKKLHQAEVIHAAGVQFRRVTTLLDQYVLNPWVQRCSKLLWPKQSPFSCGGLHLSYALQVAWDLRSQGCDVVHVQNFSQFVPIIRRFNPRIKIVLHTHNEWLMQFDHDRIVRRLAQTDLVVACSDYLTTEHRQRFPEFSDRCVTVFNGVDPHRFMPLEKPFGKRLLFIGRVSPEKGVHTLLEAFNQLAAIDPEVQLTIVGALSPISRLGMLALSRDPQVRSLANLCDRYVPYLHSLLSPTAAARVHFVGEVEQSQLSLYLQQSDVLVNPSFSESCGLSVVEAMATGLPVVAAEVGGMTNTVVAGETGLFFQAGNVAQLTETLRSLLQNPDYACVLGQRGRQRALERFTWDAAAQQLLLHDRALQSRVSRATPVQSIPAS